MGVMHSTTINESSAVSVRVCRYFIMLNESQTFDNVRIYSKLFLEYYLEK